MKKLLIALFLISILLIVGCVPQPAAPQPPANEQKPVEPVNTKPLVEPPAEDLKNKIEPGIRALFEKAEEKTQSMHYTYRGPETNAMVYEVYMKGNLVRIDTKDSAKDVNTYDEGYNALYLDVVARTAEGYCDQQECKRKGLKKTLNYDETYIPTPLDWARKIEQAEKSGEEQVDNRKSWRIETNIGQVYVDSYSGLIQRIDGSDGKKYEFIRIEQNGVKDEEIRPELYS